MCVSLGETCLATSALIIDSELRDSQFADSKLVLEKPATAAVKLSDTDLDYSDTAMCIERLRVG